MSIPLYILVLLTIITYQTISSRRAYKLGQLKKAEAKTPQEVQPQKRAEEQSYELATPQGSSGYYAITHKESLTPLAKLKSLSKHQPKLINQ
ncbi:hypothetical protein GO755_26000 [Spirosoma sp. HMF4905]|uniref:Uncharacterized protein n=1 Tax=Spirosoma arboris TaxID=2682092 RepID=A0A7K1SI66_9BACT|nr:hypothetical protein [Spirosoma arboris]MVM33517.1 hypothetical protein [Spirosoma arboris]